MIEWFEKRRYFAVILAVLIAIEIFWFSSLPGIMSGFGEGVNIKLSPIYHFTIFFLLNFFLIISWNVNQKSKYIVYSIIFSLIYSIVDEVHQLFIPFRTSSTGDIFIDSAGIFFSTLVYIHFKNKTKEKRRFSGSEKH